MVAEYADVVAALPAPPRASGGRSPR